METVHQLIYAKWIIPCHDNDNVLMDHALVIQDKQIKAILPQKIAAETYSPDIVVHLDSHVVMPGFINCHTHLAMNAFRGLADDLELMNWLNHYIWPAEGKWVSEELVYDMSMLAMAEMIRSGTICFNDMYFFLNETAKAAEIAGLRAHIGMTLIDVPTAWAKTTDEYFAKGLEFYEQYKNHERIQPTMAPHSTYTVSLENLAKAKAIADEFNLKINIHLQEAPSEIAQSIARHQKRPLARLQEINMLDNQLIAIHMTQIDQPEFDMIQQSKMNIVHCPESNMKLVSGHCPVEQLRHLNINVALGTDGAASNNDLNMFGEMRSAAFLGKMTAQNPEAVPAHFLLQMATRHGAKALGIDHITGSLAEGKSADFIAIDMNQIETQPLYHPISQIVYATARDQVTDVWVCGKPLMRNRELLTIDKTELLKKAEWWGKKIKN